MGTVEELELFVKEIKSKKRRRGGLQGKPLEELGTVFVNPTEAMSFLLF